MAVSQWNKILLYNTWIYAFVSVCYGGPAVGAYGEITDSYFNTGSNLLVIATPKSMDIHQSQDTPGIIEWEDFRAFHKYTWCVFRINNLYWYWKLVGDNIKGPLKGCSPLCQKSELNQCYTVKLSSALSTSVHSCGSVRTAEEEKWKSREKPWDKNGRRWQRSHRSDQISYRKERGREINTVFAVADAEAEPLCSVQSQICTHNYAVTHTLKSSVWSKWV